MQVSVALDRMETIKGWISVKDVILDNVRVFGGNGKLGIVAKALLGELVMPDFTAFAVKMRSNYHTVQVSRRMIAVGWQHFSANDCGVLYCCC